MRSLSTRLGFPLAILVAEALVAPAALANGLMVTSSGGRGAQSPISVSRHRVTATIKNGVADVEVEQTFHSASGAVLEGEYLFPLPEGATVGKFAMTMGGKMVEGEVVDAAKAREVYEGIVRRRLDPGLLEYVGRGLYRAKVFPIPAGGDVSIRLSFQQVLPEDAGTIEFRYPLATDRMNGGPVGEVSVEVGIESDVDVKAVYSPSHAIAVVRDGEKKARATFSRAGRVEDKDFLLYVGRSPEAVGFSTLSRKDAGEEGTFLAVISPRNETSQEEVAPRDVVYVLDTSGSMEGEKLVQAKKALAIGIGLLRPSDRFSLITFASSVNAFRDAPVAATPEAKRAAGAYIEGLKAVGGTNIDEALSKALALRDEGRLPIVVFVTDGRPTVGEQNPDRLVARAADANPAHARVFTFGVGTDLDVSLLDRIAEATGGARDYVTTGEDLEIATGRFFAKVDRPVLSDVKIDFGPGVSDVYPKRIPDLFAGSQVVVFGRYREGGRRTITLRGRVGTKEFVREYPCAWTTADGAAFLPRLWAHRKVAYLLDEIRLHGESRELTDEVTKLATRHGIVTPYTSGLVVEDSASSGIYQTKASGASPLGAPGLLPSSPASAPGDSGGRASAGARRPGPYRGPNGSVPPGLREPNDSTPPPPPPPTISPPTTTPSAPSQPWSPPATTPAGPSSGSDPGAEARRSRDLAKKKDDGGAGASEVDGVRSAAGKTFVRGADDRWVDTTYDGKKPTTKVEAFSKDYFDLLVKHPEVAKLFAVAERVVFLLGDVAYEVVPAAPSEADGR